MSDYDDFLSEIPTGPSSASSRLGKYEAMLSADVRADLETFVLNLELEGKSKGTAQSYKSHVAKALAMRQTWSQMSNDQHSAARAWKRLMAS